MLQRDGKSDKIFFQFYFTIANRTGATRFTYALRSDTYGDATGAFSNRVSAGSCVDMFGGVKGVSAPATISPVIRSLENTIWRQAMC